MKTLHTIVVIGALSLGLAAFAGMGAAAPSHSMNGPERLTNAELLNLSDKELRLWTHGAFAGLGHGLIAAQPEHGRCIWDWYFGGEDRFPTIKAAMERYGEAGPSATILAIANRACPA